MDLFSRDLSIFESREINMGNAVLSIDPGNIQSGYTLISLSEETFMKPLAIGKVDNEYLYKQLEIKLKNPADLLHVVVEMVACYGMPVGKSIFDTCVYIGMLKGLCHTWENNLEFMYRKDVKMNLCNSTKAKDSNVSQALKDRFSYLRHLAKGGKGTKKDPGFFFGFNSDIWQAYALGVTYIDTILQKEELRQ